MSTTAGARDIIEAFQEVPTNSRLELLLEYSEALPALPQRYEEHPELLERVEECQSPVYLFVELSSENIVNIFLTAPDEAPTTKGFASLLQSSLDNEPAETVLNFDESFVDNLGITDLVSPLRIRGLQGMLMRIKRQVKEKMN
ncbi:MAG: SufE family protein [Rhodoluna sp.]